jgi:hypothetical protein
VDLTVTMPNSVMCWALLWGALVPTVATANVPAAYFPCEGAADGDACDMTGFGRGACVLDTLCTDDTAEDSPWNECLLCGDPCRGQAEGAVCTLPDTTEGVCTRGPDCAPDPRRSFDVCNRCLPTEGNACRRPNGDGVGHWATVSGDDCNQLGVVAAFGQCWRCAPGPGTLVPPAPGGCTQAALPRPTTGLFGAVLLWVCVAVGLWRERARR